MCMWMGPSVCMLYQHCFETNIGYMYTRRRSMFLDLGLLAATV